MSTNQNNKRPRGRSSARNHPLAPAVNIAIHLCIADDQQRWLPKRRRAPHNLPANAPLPRMGEVIYLSSSSAWAVVMVIHEWLSVHDLRIEVWLEHVLGARHQRPSGFSITQ